MTADGKITTRKFTSVDFTSPEDKLHLLRQRSLGDAVLVGHSTLRCDNLRLGVAREELRAARLKRGQPAYPLRIIVSNAGRIDARLNIFKTDFAPIIIFSTTRMPRLVQRALAGKATLHLAQTPQVDLHQMMRILRDRYQVRTIACEGGAKLFRALLESGLVDQLNLTVAPFLFGGETAPTLTGVSKDFLPNSARGRLVDMQVKGEECFLTYRFSRRTR